MNLFIGQSRPVSTRAPNMRQKQVVQNQWKHVLGILRGVQTRTVALSSKSVQFCGVGGQMKLFIG